MKVMVLGAGALGGYFGARLQEAGHDVAFVARGEHLAAMQTDGLRVESPLGDIRLPRVRAVADPREAGQADLVLFMVKTYDAEAAAASLAPLMTPETLVITAQNGVSAQPILAAAVGRAAVLPGAVYMPADIKAPGVIRHSAAFHRIVFGPWEPEAMLRAQEVRTAFEAAGLDAQVSDDIWALLWQKFVMMAANSAITTLTRLDIGPIRETPETLDLLATARGRNLPGCPRHAPLGGRGCGRKGARLPSPRSAAHDARLDAGRSKAGQATGITVAVGRSRPARTRPWYRYSGARGRAGGLDALRAGQSGRLGQKTMPPSSSSPVSARRSLRSGITMPRLPSSSMIPSARSLVSCRLTVSMVRPR